MSEDTGASPLHGVTFTQYLLPDGRTQPVTIERSEEIAKKAEELIKNGFLLEVEILRTGQVSMTCEYPHPEYERVTVVHIICANGPEVPKYVDELITRAHNIYQNNKDEDGKYIILDDGVDWDDLDED